VEERWKEPKIKGNEKDLEIKYFYKQL